MFGKFLFFGIFIFAVTSQNIPCELPPFTGKLPAKQSQQLKETWANYKNGSNCEEQKNKTFEIIGTLTDEQREAIFGREQDEALIEDQFDTTPNFIKSLSSEVKKGFDAIWMDMDIKDVEKHKKLQQYADDHFTEDQKEGFKPWITEVINARKAHEERINNLNPKTRELYEKIVRVREETRKLMSSITPEQSRELNGLI